MNNLPEPLKLTVDTASITTAILAITGVLTNVIGLLAAVASLVWACIRVYETDTFKNWLASRKSK